MDSLDAGRPPVRRRIIRRRIIRRVVPNRVKPPVVRRVIPPPARNPVDKPRTLQATNVPPAKRPTALALAYIPGFDVPTGKVDTKEDKEREKKAAEMDAKIERMKQQLAMLAKLREARLKHIQHLARQEALRERRMKDREKAHQQRLKQDELQRKAKLALEEQQLKAKMAQMALENRNQWKKEKNKWQAELARIRSQRQTLDAEMIKKRKRLEKLQRLALLEEKRVARRRSIHKKLLNQEKSEIEAIRRQRYAAQKQLASYRKLLKKQQSIQKERRRWLQAARQKKNRKEQERAKRRLAKLKKEEQQVKQAQQQVNKEKKFVQSALSEFNQGNCSQAAAFFKRAGKAELGQKLNEFETQLRMGRGAYERRDAVVAIPLLERALTLDLEIGGGNSKFTYPIRQMLANLYMIKGRIEMSRNDYADAFLYFRTARRYQPKHRRVAEYLQELRQKAHSFFQMAITQYKDNTSMRRRYLRNVTRLLYPSDPLYTKALNLLNS